MRGIFVAVQYRTSYSLQANNKNGGPKRNSKKLSVFEMFSVSSKYKDR